MFNFLKKKSNRETAIKRFQKVGLSMEEADYMIWDIIMTDMDDWSQEHISEKDLEKLYNSKHFTDTVDMLLNGKSPVKDIAYTGLIAKTMGYDFATIASLRFSIFQIIEEKKLDNSFFKELFLKMLNSSSSTIEDITPVLNLLYAQGWITDVNNEVYSKAVMNMVEGVGLQQTLENMTTLMDEAKGWYAQVNNPQSDLQKITNLSLEWIGGKLSDIYDDLLDNYEPLELIIYNAELQKKVYNALLEAEKLENFPELNISYRNEVSSRFLQYMTELLKSNIIEERYMEENIEEDEFYFDDEENKLIAPRGTSQLISILHMIVKDFGNKDFLIKKIWHDTVDEKDIWFSIIGEEHTTRYIQRWSFHFYEYNILIESKVIIGDEENILNTKLLTEGLDDFMDYYKTYWD